MSEAPRTSAESVSGPFDRRARQLLAGSWFALLGLLGLVLLVAANALRNDLISSQQFMSILWVGGSVGLVLGIAAPLVIYASKDQRAAEALLGAGHHEAAIRLLKRHMENDECCWLIARAYDQMGSQRLALESYREYLRRHKQGHWKVEAKVRLEELDALLPRPDPPPRDVHVQAEPARDPSLRSHCPYCKDEIAAESLTVECAACGTAHHLRCYEEQNGCAIYGCKSHKARARVQE